jgi:hypothetical protein
MDAFTKLANIINNALNASLTLNTFAYIYKFISCVYGCGRGCMPSYPYARVSYTQSLSLCVSTITMYTVWFLYIYNKCDAYIVGCDACMNGGTCLSSNPGSDYVFSCVCPTDYNGIYCEHYYEPDG